MFAKIDALTDKEKETLRLIVRGHDAKSAARELDLSVHTINERLRNARRKLDVTSSREAARVLFEREQQTPQNLADSDFGEVLITEKPHTAKRMTDSDHLFFREGRFGVIVIGGLIMISTLAFMLLASVSGDDDNPSQVNAEQAVSADSETSSAAIIDQSKMAAVAWLKLVDAEDWQASYDAAGAAFRAPNTVATWRDASRQARAPLGDVQSRAMVQYQPVNAPPNGYLIVRFRTDFSRRKAAIETVTLEREGDELKVVGYFIN